MNYELLTRVRKLSTEQLADIALKMAEAHPDTFERFVIGTALTYTIPQTDQRVTFTLSEVNQIAAEAALSKVNAIKLVRNLTGIGLKEAKDLVESEWAR